MIFKFTLLVVLCVVYASSQSSESDSRCNPQPTCNCYCGTSGPHPVGRKDQKGERGRPDDTAEELMDLKRQIDELKNLTLHYPTSCNDVTARSNRTSGYYAISPARYLIPIIVYCNFSANNTETIIYHNTPSEVQVANCEAARCSKHKIAYDVTLPNIIALIDQSAECRQFIKYRCIASLLLRNTDNPTFATWLSRDRTPQIYWGGATSRRDNYCACGETNSCVDTNYNCNCDSNNAPETSDEGYLTEKDKLPVTELQLGDNSDPHEAGWFTLGPLICSGRSA